MVIGMALVGYLNDLLDFGPLFGIYRMSLSGVVIKLFSVAETRLSPFAQE
jgi:hypothetical protein